MPYEKEIERYEDVLLTYDNVQQLSSRESVAAFFSALHYDTDARVEQTTAALGFSSDALRGAIRYIERVAFHEDFDAFSVYLFELTRMTVAVRNEIVRGFRNRTGNYLLVLTDDYERLDFVLVERYTQTITAHDETYEVQALPGNKPVLVRPRVLQVMRRAPGDVEMRVLRRFTYTEADTIAQYEKLLNAYIVAAWSEPFFNNRALFSDYYLTQRFPEQKEWKGEGEYNKLRIAFKTLFALYDDAREECRSKPQRVIWTHLFEPILRELGFRAQHVKADPKENDLNSYYRLFAASSSPSVQEKALAVCLTYPWERNLDGKDDQRDSQTPDENPGAVVVTLLDTGEADWAIVTNGILWRLYAAKAHSRATNYYEINLQETLALDPSKREEAFRYFWLFFRAAAFIPTERIVEGETRELNLLDELLQQSDLHARELGERLKNRVFEEIFPYFARGFVNHARQHDLLPANLDSLSSDERNRLLEPYFTATLTFLYRLLFLFYAESRDLLPVRQERSYYEQSLECLKQEIAQKAGNLQDRVASNLAAYAESSTAIYERLVVLFAAVDKGNAALNVPIYNGGLFMTNPPPLAQDEPQEITVARFLKEHKITDRQLALGLDRMARDVDEKLSKARQASGEANDHSHALIFIDYKSLGVRHLGSIYEGLLEFKLRIAPETMAVVEGKRTEEIVPYSEAVQQKQRILTLRQGKERKERLYEQGAVYLENDRRERKATGSYYTPDYIVQYIVEQTVGPILKEKLEKLRGVFRAAQEHLKGEQDKLKALRREDMDPAHNTYNAYRISLNEAFFDLKVLDPAMGSGHFLVEVVDYITDQLAKFLNGFRWNPVVYELALTRKKIEDGMREQGVTVDRDKLTDLNLLKRRVLKSCVYGVDVTPMAVELAKVSLWLDCFTLGAPLSFLDHHMKCGNSLIGANVEDVHRGIRENLFGYQFGYLLQAAQLMRGVSKLSDVTAREVAESHETYQQAYEALAPYKRLFDIWLSQYFGNKKAQDIANQHAQAIIDNKFTGLDAGDVSAIHAALPLAASKRFFHWELEFPEVFFDEAKRKEDGGFDAVVGNPPYVRQEGLGDDKAAFKALYAVFNSIADLYTYFIERSHVLLRPNGRFSMITANKFMRANYGAALRSFLTTKVKLETLIDFGDLPVFGDATTYPIIIVSTKAQRDGAFIEYASLKSLSFDKLDTAIKSTVSKMPESAFHGANWSLAADLEQSIFDKLKVNSTSLEKYVSSKVRRGVLTGFNEAFIITQATRDRLVAEDPKSAEIIKPFLVGENIHKYLVDFQNKYLIWTYIGVSITEYPAIYHYLQQYQVQLEKRWDKGNHWWELRHCDYYADFEKPKIIFPDIANGCQFAYSTGNEFSGNTTYFIACNNLFLLATINSSLIEFFYRSKTAVYRGGYLRFFTQCVNETPIRRINFTTSSSERARCLDKARLLYQQCVSKDDQDCVLGFVKHHLSKEPEESDVVHDLLAFLAEEMLRLNKEKRAMQKTFLAYFVDALQVKSEQGKAGIEVLTGKSRLLEFAGDYQKGEEPLAPDALWEIVQKNRSRLNARRVGLKERVLAHYQESLDQVLPLKEQLRRTDALIDQVVYCLYGLTEEEIAIVEGKG
jgi:TaqI-like C-terminal specificity domain/Eco57I restriction-modification methylase